MDAWERTVRKLYVRRSSLIVELMNIPRDQEGGANHISFLKELEDVRASMDLAILALKLNSGSTKCVEWASGLTRVSRRVS
jgi:hypothetical protein